MKKICIAIGLIMAINTSWAQVSVDDDYFPAFVEAQNSLAREKDSIDNLKLVKKIETLDSVSFVKAIEIPKIVEKQKVIESPKRVEKPKVIKKETAKYVTVKTETNFEVESPKPIRQPINQYYIEDNYQMTGTSIFSENRLVGFKFETSLREKSYFLLKLVKKDLAVNGNRTDDYYIGTYFVPNSWWYETNASFSLTYELLEYIKDNFQIKYKNEN